MAGQETQRLPARLSSAGTFRTQAEEAGATIVIRLAGELDLASTPDLAREVGRALDAHPHSIALDLSDLTFVDSIGAQAILVGGERARSRGCQFTVRSPRRHVLRTLQLTCVDQLIPIELSPTTASS